MRLQTEENLTSKLCKGFDSSSLRPLRIGMLVGSYWPDPEGGAEKQCRLLSEALTMRGCSVDVLTFRHSRYGQKTSGDGKPVIYRFGRFGPYASNFRRGIESFAFRLASPNDPSSTGRSDRQSRALAFWLALPAVWLSRLQFLIELHHFATQRLNHYDLLHVHESGWLAGVAVALGRHFHAPILCKESTAPALRPIGYDTPFRCKWDQYRRLANGWIAQTPTIRNELRTLGIADNIIHLLPNGVLLPPLPAHPEHSKEVIYIGNLTQGSYWKAFDVLFDAWIRVAKMRKDVKLTVLGGGDPTPWVNLLQKNGVRNSVCFTGHVADPSPFYRKAGIFVLPSRIEGMSNALLEAMSWGLPCVVSDIPGNRALVDHNSDGLIIPVDNSSALTDTIMSLLHNPDTRSSLGRQARNKISSIFEIHCVADRLIGIYRNQIGKKVAST